MEFDPEAFVSECIQGHDPSCLNSLSKQQLRSVASHLALVTNSSFRKTRIIKAIRDHLFSDTAGVNDSRLEESETGSEVRRMELEFQRELQDRRIKAEKELLEKRIQAEKELELLKLEAEKERFALKIRAEQELELERLRRDQEEQQRKSEVSFIKNVALVPKFEEKNPDQFFQSFERTAELFNWPKDKWGLLLQNSWSGRAQRVYVSLSDEMARDYEVVKRAILEAYEQIPEAYRQKFRSWRRNAHQSHLEFAKEKENLFDKWCRTQKVESLLALRQLVLIEEFKNCTSPQVRAYLDEKMPQDLTEAAKLADQFELSHRQKSRGIEANDFQRRPKDNPSVEPASIETKGAKAKPQAEMTKVPVQTCEFCHKRGHQQQDCWKLNGRPSSQYRRDKPVSAAAKGPKAVKPGFKRRLEQENELASESMTDRPGLSRRLEEGEKAFRSNGSVGTNELNAQPICVWRDTGAFQTLLLEGILPENQMELSKSIQVHGIMESASIPLQTVFLTTDYYQGQAEVGVVKQIPIPGVHLLLGNDLAASTVNPKSQIAESQENRVYTPEKHAEGNGQANSQKRAEPQSAETQNGREACPETVLTRSQTALLRATESSSKVPSEDTSDEENETVDPGSQILPNFQTTSESGVSTDESLPRPTDSTKLSEKIARAAEGLPKPPATAKNFEQIADFKEIPQGQVSSEVETEQDSAFAKQFEPPVERSKLIIEQENDSELKSIAEEMDKRDKDTESIFFYKQHGVLMRKWKPPDATAEQEWRDVHQIVLPRSYRNQVLSLAHDCPLSGHLGVRKTLYRIRRHFYWPNMRADVAAYCRTCHNCQVSGKPQHNPKKAALRPIPALSEPFSHIICDCVGPLPKSSSGHEYLFTIMCASTRYPVAIPLRSINAKNICDALINFFTTFGLPTRIQTDQGSNFMSKVFQQLSSTLGIKHVYSSAYHPESQGSLERYHQTLKSMMRIYCLENKDWSKGVPLLLFAIRETVQESLGFSPFELAFGHEVRGPLKLLKEKFLQEPTQEISLLDYVLKFKERLHEVGKLARENLHGSQERMKKLFDRNTQDRQFQPGDKVLVFLPIHGNPLKARYFGPYNVSERTSPVNYVVDTPDRRKRSQLCHINMMKAYYDRETAQGAGPIGSPRPTGVSIANISPGEGESWITPLKLANSEILNNLDSYLEDLGENKNSVKKLLLEFQDIASDYPTVTSWAEHDIDVGQSRPVKQNPYRENPEKREKIKKEVDYLKEHNLIEPSASDWSSPCLLVPKSSGENRFCTDFRRVNSLSIADNFPMPRIDDCVESVGQARFITKIDLLKGYYQIPLTERAKRISAFVTSEGMYEYRVMAFGMRNAAATFQRLANRIVEGLQGCGVYIDDIVLYSDTWEQHVDRLRQLFERLRMANLTINLAKSKFGQKHIEYLGFHLGDGQVRPAEAKIKVLQQFPPPRTRKELRRFLGMAAFYKKFCKDYSEIVLPLTKLSSPKLTFVWSDECQLAFQRIKDMLTAHPVLAIPSFDKPFKLLTDASNVGMGAVLVQEGQEGEDHPVAYFSKKFDRHQLNYSTIEKEALALVSSLRHFAHYLKNGCTPVHVFTDHNPLVFINKMRNHNQRLLRWSLELQEFQLIISHIKGRENSTADYLSRSPSWELQEKQ